MTRPWLLEILVQWFGVRPGNSCFSKAPGDSAQGISIIPAGCSEALGSRMRCWGVSGAEWGAEVLRLNTWPGQASQCSDHQRVRCSESENKHVGYPDTPSLSPCLGQGAWRSCKTEWAGGAVFSPCSWEAPASLLHWTFSSLNWLIPSQRKQP